MSSSAPVSRQGDVLLEQLFSAENAEALCNIYDKIADFLKPFTSSSPGRTLTKDKSTSLASLSKIYAPFILKLLKLSFDKLSPVDSPDSAETAARLIKLAISSLQGLHHLLSGAPFEEDVQRYTNQQILCVVDHALRTNGSPSAAARLGDCLQELCHWRATPISSVSQPCTDHMDANNLEL